MAGSEPSIGRIGRFELKVALGGGGFGVVYRAYDPVLGRQVALKLPRFGSDETRKVKRFVAEAKSAARLRHPNIVGVFDSGRTDDGQYFIASEFIDGQPLSAYTRREFGEAGPVPVGLRTKVEWVRDLALALAYAHGEAVVHRDIKPDNILIDKEHGRPQITDFGLAKQIDDQEASLQTQDGSVLGTPAYMAPEQARGDLKSVGPASDQYSLGVVLHELLAGQRPFTGQPHELLIAVAGPADPPPIRSIERSVPKDLAAISDRAVAKRIDRRYASCAAMAADVDRWLSGETVRARPVGPVVRLGRWGKRNPAVAGLAIALATVVAVGFGVVTASLGTATIARDQAETAKEDLEEALRVAQSNRERAEAEQSKAEHAANELQAALDATIRERERAETQKRLAEQKSRQADAEKRRADARADEAVVANYRPTIQAAYQRVAGANYADARALLDRCQTSQRHWEWHACHRLSAPHIVSGAPKLPGLWSPSHVAFHPKGNRLVFLGSSNGPMPVLMDIETSETTPLVPQADLSYGVDIFEKFWGVPFTHASFSDDGSRLVTTSGLYGVTIWDADTLSPLKQVPIDIDDRLREKLQLSRFYVGQPYALVISPSGRRLSIWTNAGRFSLDLETGSSNHHQWPPYSSRLDQTSQYLISSDRSLVALRCPGNPRNLSQRVHDRVHVFDTTTFKERKLFRLAPNTRVLALSGGGLLYALVDRQSLVVMDVDGEVARRSAEGLPLGHVVLSANGSTLSLGDVILNAKTLETVEYNPAWGLCHALSPDGEFAVCAPEHPGALRLRRLYKGSLHANIDTRRATRAAAFNDATGDITLLSEVDGMPKGSIAMHTYDAASGALSSISPPISAMVGAVDQDELSRLTYSHFESSGQCLVLRDHRAVSLAIAYRNNRWSRVGRTANSSSGDTGDSLVSAAMHPEGTLIALGDDKLLNYDFHYTVRWVERIQGVSSFGSRYPAVVAPAGDKTCVVSNDALLLFQGPKCVAALSASSFGASLGRAVMKFDRSGSRLLVGPELISVDNWRSEFPERFESFTLQSQRQRRPVELEFREWVNGPRAALNSHPNDLTWLPAGSVRLGTKRSNPSHADFLPDGTRVVSGFTDGSVRLWDASTGLEIARLVKFESPVSTIDFSADGRYLLACSEDGKFRLFDAGKPFPAAPGPVPDGKVE